MLSVLLLAFFLVQFLAILGVILFAILFSRPEVPLQGDGGLKRIVAGDDKCALQQREAEPAVRGNGPSSDSQAPMSRLKAARPPFVTAFSFTSVGGLGRKPAQSPFWLANN